MMTKESMSVRQLGAILVVVALLLGAGFGVATAISGPSAKLEERVRQNEVKRAEMETQLHIGLKEINRRLDRIERKLDRSLRHNGHTAEEK